MDKNKYNLKLTSIYLKLMELYFVLPFKYGFDKERNMKINKELLSLYKEYVELLMQVQETIPLLENDAKLRNGSCYLYALGLSIPSIFKGVYETLISWQCGADPGEISGYTAFIDSWTEQEFLERIYADFDSLKIDVYPSTINAPIKHDGYKIACFLDKDGEDYHFARQNVNGLWSQKLGFADKIYLSDNPMAFLDDIHNYKYELIRTLEIVKPDKRNRG